MLTVDRARMRIGLDATHIKGVPCPWERWESQNSKGVPPISLVGRILVPTSAVCGGCALKEKVVDLFLILCVPSCTFIWSGEGCVLLHAPNFSVDALLWDTEKLVIEAAWYDYIPNVSSVHTYLLLILCLCPSLICYLLPWAQLEPTAISAANTKEKNKRRASFATN